MFEALGATSAYPITPSQWMPSNRLTLPGRFSKFVAKASRLTYPYLYRIGNVPRAYVSFGLQILAWLSQGRVVRQIKTLTQDSDCIIWDAAEVSKKYMEPLLYLFRSVRSYSIRHGIGLQPDPEEINGTWETPDRSISENVTVFAMALTDIAQLEKTMGVLPEQLIATGIYRHHPDWIKEITSQESENDRTYKRDTLLVISRGFSFPNQYLPRERLLGYLQDIKSTAERFNLRVVVKPHPKETDLSPYPEVFGSEAKDVDWEISDLHLAILAKRAIFAVSFFSGSCLDLTAYDVPTIERLDLVGLPNYDLPSAIRDWTGAPVLEYRHHGHVLGSSTSEEFFNRVEEVMRDRARVMRELAEAYSRHFVSPPMNPKELSKQISNSCFDISDP